MYSVFDNDDRVAIRVIDFIACSPIAFALVVATVIIVIVLVIALFGTIPDKSVATKGCSAAG